MRIFFKQSYGRFYRSVLRYGAIIVSSYLAVLLLQVPQVSAAPWKAGNIIDEITFTNVNSMDLASIQNFLNSKVPSCDTNHARSSNTNDPGPPYTCLKNYSEGGRSSAQIIYDVSRQYGINPQVLIVLLQKEQGLVTDSWPWPIQYRSATGYGCPDTAPCDSQYYGLTNQLSWAAKMFQAINNGDPDWYTPYVLGNNFIRYNPQSSCGGTNVVIENRSTQALYNYTPYQPNPEALAAGYGSAPPCGAYGNRNFWLYFNDWFGNTQVAGKWLRQGPNGQVWLVAEGLMPDGSYARKKFKLTSWDTYLAYFLQYEQVVPVSYEYLAQFIDDGVLGTRTIGRSYSQIQFVNNGNRYYVADGATCDAWGFDCFNTNFTKTIPGTEFLERLNGMAQAVPPVMAYNGTVYKLQDGKKRPLINGDAFNDLGYSWNNILYNAQAINAQQPIGELVTSGSIALSFNGGPFLLYNKATGAYHPINELSTFNAWRLQKTANTSPPTSTYNTSPPNPTSPALSIWAADSMGRKYVVDNGRKIDVTSNTSSLPNVTWSTTGEDLLAKLPAASFGSYSISNQTGGVYLLEGGKKRHVPTWSNFLGLKLAISQLLPLESSTLDKIPDGYNKLSEGALFETSTGVHIVNGSNSYHIPAYSFFGTYSLDVDNRVKNKEDLSTAYPTSGEFKTMIKDSSNNIFIASKGKKLAINSSTASEWGAQSSQFLLLTSDNLNRLSTGQLGRFISHNGGVYYGSGGQKHHIQSYSTFVALGGNASDLPVVYDDFFDSLPTGAPIP